LTSEPKPPVDPLSLLSSPLANGEPRRAVLPPRETTESVEPTPSSLPPATELAAIELAAIGVTSIEAAEVASNGPWYRRQDSLGLLGSLLGHLLLILILALILMPQRRGDGPLTIEGWDSQPVLTDSDFQITQANDSDAIQFPSVVTGPLPNPLIAAVPEVSAQSLDRAALATVPQILAPQDQLAEGGGGLTGRSAAKRAELVQRHGGTPESETAVDRGLEWLARHQWPDGGWSFRHPKKSRARNSGSSASRTAATGLALLCFLGRDHHHVKPSEYQKVVLNGLNFLLQTSRDGDLTQLTEHSMYGQGMATLALAEAYALSQDPALKEPTQQAIDFIVAAQHPLGGWRYMPGQLGDINVTGWQWMALKTAGMAGLDVPPETMQKTIKFVNSQTVSPGAYFTYPGLDPTVPQPVPTAIGLLIRLHQGWGLGRDEIQMGIDYLITHRISVDHIYFNYYANMVLFHTGGPRWKAWNEELRDYLINTQSDAGDERGSWYFPHAKTGNEGGRLYCTAMGILILEVYYRHLKLYDPTILVRDFPLD
jgi:hypothetical protein